MLFLAAIASPASVSSCPPGSLSRLELAGGIPGLPFLLSSKLLFPRTPFCISLQEAQKALPPPLTHNPLLERTDYLNISGDFMPGFGMPETGEY